MDTWSSPFPCVLLGDISHAILLQLPILFSATPFAILNMSKHILSALAVRFLTFH